MNSTHFLRARGWIVGWFAFFTLSECLSRVLELEEPRWHTTAASGSGLTAPQGFQATYAATNGEVLLSWQAVPDAAWYDLLRSTSNDLATASILVTNVVDSTQHTDFTAALGQDYWYWVRGSTPTESGPWSEGRQGLQGSRKWRISASFQSLPAIGNDGTVYFLGNNSETGFGSLMAVAGEDGSERWHRDFLGRVQIPPVLSEDGRIFVSNGKDSVLALSPSGDVVWEMTESRGQPSRPMSLTASGLLIYAASRPSLIARSSRTGQKVWDIPFAPLDDLGPVVAADGTIWIPASPQNLVALNPDGSLQRRITLAIRTQMALSQDGDLLAADGNFTPRFIRSDGTLGSVGNTFSLFSPAVALASNLFAIPSVAPPDLIIASSATGGIVSRWTNAWPRQPYTSLVAGSDGSYYAVDLPNIHVLDSNGVLRARWARNGGAIQGMILGDDGTLLIPEQDHLSAFRVSSGPDTNTWAMWRKDRRNSASWEIPRLPEPASGLVASESRSINSVGLHWTRSSDLALVEVWRSMTMLFDDAERIATPLATQTNFTDYNRTAGSTAFYWLRSLSLSGVEVGREGPLASSLVGGPHLAWQRSFSGVLSPPSRGDDGTLYLSPSPGFLTALNPDGTDRWTFTNVALYGAYQPVLGPTGRMLVFDGQHLLGMDPDGKQAWSQTLQPEANDIQMAVSDLGLVAVVGSFGLRTFTLDGNERWWIQDAPHSGVAFASDGSLYATLSGGLRHITAAGEVLWTQEASSPFPISSSLTTTGAGDVIVIGQGGGIHRVSGLNGAIEWSIPTGAEAGNGPVVMTPGGGWIVPVGFTHLTVVGSNGVPAADLTQSADDVTVAEDGTLLLSRPGGIFAVNPEGTVQWSYDLPIISPRTPVLLSSDGQIHFGTGSNLLAFQTDLRPARAGWTTARANNRRTGQWLPGGENRPWLSAIVAKGGTAFEVTLITRSNVVYQLDATTNFSQWQGLGEFMGLGGPTNFIWQPDAISGAFLRAKTKP